MSSCPISGELIDERAARIIGAFVVAASVGYVISGWFVWLWLLGFDFAMRIFRCDWSPFRWLALKIRQRYLTPSFVDAAPKMFAARLGLTMVIAALILHGIGWVTAARTVTTLLLIASLLEAAFGFCLGCRLYGLMGLFGGKAAGENNRFNSP